MAIPVDPEYRNRSSSKTFAMVMTVLILGGILAAIAGLLFMSQATTGVGLLAAACFVAILARIAQAAKHHAERR